MSMPVALILGGLLAPHDDDGVRFCCPTADVFARVAGAHSICLFQRLRIFCVQEGCKYAERSRSLRP